MRNKDVLKKLKNLPDNTKEYVDNNEFVKIITDFEIISTGKAAKIYTDSLTIGKRYRFPFESYPNLASAAIIKKYADGTTKTITTIRKSTDYIYVSAINGEKFDIYHRSTFGTMSRLNGSFGTTSSEYTSTFTKVVLDTVSDKLFEPTKDYHPTTKKYVDDKTASVPQIISEKVLCEVNQKQLATAWTQCQASTDSSMYIELPIFEFKDDIYSLHYIMINNKTYLLDADYNEEFSETSTRHFFEFYDVDDEINNIYGGCIGTKYDINWDDDETKVIVKIDRIDKTKPPVFTSNVQLIEKELKPFDYNYLGKHIILNQPVTIGSRKEGKVGGYSISIGFNNLAANSSFACGYSAEASGDSSHAEGNNTTSSGRCSHAEGIYTQATGDYSHTEGFTTVAAGDSSHAEGNKTKASSPNQHVQGKYNIEDTNGKYAHIVGNGTNESTRSNAHTLDWKGNGWYAGKLSQEGTPVEDKDLTTKKYVNDLVEKSKTAMCTDEEIDNMLNEVLGGDYSGNQ